MKTILVIDDDRKLTGLLEEYLSKYGFQVTSANHPHDGLRLLDQETYGLIILDVMLPEMDGFEVCREIRKKSSIPIIMLTARGEVTDRIVGLEIGADDYLPKPFEPRELVARIQAIQRRQPEESSKPTIVSEKTQINFEGLIVDLQKRTIFLDQQEVELTSAEFEILQLFTENPNVVLDRDRIMEEVRGIEWESFNRSVDVLVSRVRQKLNDDPKHPRFLKTIWGTGYMFIGNPK
ncbi:MAG: DNA-binding response OmpR family regulator [bacterium]|jgi:DNA-binding response OmpR family regulator